jgi:Fur family zinc uptake transcriptional regulator
MFFFFFFLVSVSCLFPFFFNLANKIESLNAYIGCPFPSSQRSYIFLICENCKNVAEVSTGSVDNSLALIMEKLKFKLRKQHIEVRGICSRCSP